MNRDSGSRQIAAATGRQPTARHGESPAETESPIAPTPIPQLNPDLSRIFALIRQHDTGGARVRLRDYLAIHPGDGHAHFLFGLTFHREQKYGQAAPHFERAIALAPDYPPARHFLGWARYYLGELDASRAAFEAFLQMQPDEPDSLFALGLIALDEHDLDQAQIKFERAIDITLETLETMRTDDGRLPSSPAMAKMHARLSEVHEQRGDLELARQHLQTAVDFNPDAYEAMYKLYRVLVRLDRMEEAQAMHTRYLQARERVRPSHPPAPSGGER